MDKAADTSIVHRLISLLDRVPLCTGLTQSFALGYTPARLKQDAVAGLVVSLVALPLSMALSIAIGLPPQHGLYTAIVAGFVAAIFGGARMQVTGPTAAFVVILAPIVAEFGLRGIIWCQLLAGAMLLILGITRMGRAINYVPYPVTTGFTSGIAIVIATIALADLLGVKGATQGHWPEKVSALIEQAGAISLPAIALGAVTLAIMALLPRLTKAIPPYVVGIVLATLAAAYLNRHGFALETIGSRFSFTDAQGQLQQGIPSMPPSLHVPGLSADPIYALPTLAELQKWLVPSAVIAALAALESLLSATVADSMAGTRHDPNAELNGSGLGNIASGLFLGIPATGAITRTAVNVGAGAFSPISVAIHSVLLLIYMMVLAPLIKYIPMTALSALLLLTALRMAQVPLFIKTIRTSPPSDVAVLLVCFGFTVMIDMVSGVIAGFLIASLIFMKRSIDSTQTQIHTARDPEHELDLPAGTLLFRIDGPLFFGTAEKAFDRAKTLTHEAHTVLIDMDAVPVIDLTGLQLLEELLQHITNDGRIIHLSAPHDTASRIRRKLPATLRENIRFHASVRTALRQLSRAAD